MSGSTTNASSSPPSSQVIASNGPAGQRRARHPVISAGRPVAGRSGTPASGPVTATGPEALAR
ncbi:MAG: hypothetical protein ACLQFR_03360 [Streptosporangiaceae bacterium]